MFLFTHVYVRNYNVDWEVVARSVSLATFSNHFLA